MLRLSSPLLPLRAALARRALGGLACTTLVSGAAGCEVGLETAADENPVPFACESNQDCSAGRCMMDLGFCGVDNTALSTLLFEVTPRSSDPVYGGARYFTIQGLEVPSEADARARGLEPGVVELNVPPQIAVAGRVFATSQPACLAPLSLARSTLPVTLTFTPLERLLGLSAPSYELSTRFDERTREYVVNGSLPPGRYDVTMRPDSASLHEDCGAIPQLFRNEVIGAGLGSNFDLAEPSTLRLTIAWQDNLEGWTLDMVHPVTGEVISNRVLLSAANVADGRLITTLSYSRADLATSTDGGAIQSAGEELIRLQPPDGVLAGTVLLQRSGLELIAPGEGAIGNISKFGAPVDFQSWVWKAEQNDTPVPATVTFAALDLDEVDDGVLTSFSSSAIVNPQGQIQATLLPGRYRIRVTPPSIEVNDLGLLAGFESTLTVWPSATADPTVQAGQVITVPPAVTVLGQVLTQGSNTPVSGVSVRLSAGNPNRNPCTGQPGMPGSGMCERPRAAVLRRALAEDAFVPRTRSAITAGDGTFTINGLDCGQCRETAGARFDLSVRPPADSGLAWLVRPAVDLYQDEPVGTLSLPVPSVTRMKLTYDTPLVRPDDVVIPRSLSGALVRAYAMLDNTATVVADATGLLPCPSVPAQEGTRCLQSLVQVAELRSDSDGQVLLLLPPELE